jgi:hypothetical protein
MNGTETCEICGKPNANVAYFRTGMAEIVYRHHECDRKALMREASPSEERQEWGINQWLVRGWGRQ